MSYCCFRYCCVLFFRDLFFLSNVSLHVNIYYCYLKSFIRLHVFFEEEKKNIKYSLYILHIHSIYSIRVAETENERCTKKNRKKSMHKIFNPQTNFFCHHEISTKKTNKMKKFNSNFLLQIPFRNIFSRIWTVYPLRNTEETKLKFPISMAGSLNAHNLKLHLFKPIRIWMATKSLNHWKVSKKMRSTPFNSNFDFRLNICTFCFFFWKSLKENCISYQKFVHEKFIYFFPFI